MRHLTITSAGPQDARDIWKWRNDPQTRAMSVNTAPIDYDDHAAWFARMIADPAHVFYIGLDAARRKVGLCRFDIADDRASAEARLNLNPLCRGRGYGNALLQKAITKFRSINPALGITAHIRHGNTPSLACFEKAGFTLLREDQDFKYLVNKLTREAP